MAQRGRARSWWSWRRAVYPLVAVWVDVACAGRLLARRRRRTGPPLPRLLLRLPLDLLGFLVASYVWLLLPVNWAYPLRSTTGPDGRIEDWGGPTLVGAWAVHALGATLLFAVAGLPLLSGVTWLLETAARRRPGT